MFEELYRNSGQVLIPTGEYTDGKEQYAVYPVTYFAKDATFRDDTGALQCETVYFCRGVPDMVYITADARFITSDGTGSDIRTAARLFNHFDNHLEAWKLVVV